MKVLIVSEPGVDGVFRYVEALCHFLVSQDVEVHLAYSDRRGSAGLRYLVDFIAENGGATLNLRTINRPALSDAAAFLALARLARAVGPDVIHSHSSKAGALARGLKYLGIHAVQIYQPHAYIGMRPNRGPFDYFYDAVESALGRTAATITCSSGECAYSRQRLGLSPDRVFQLRHGVDVKRFRPAAVGEKQQLRKLFGLPLAGLILGFIGRSSPQKDPLTLYRAFGMAAAADPNIFLFHVGKGEFDSQLDRLTREIGMEGRVFRCPYLSTPADFYRAVDGFILTSRYEGFSLAALEALAADLPMILSDAPGNADLLEEPLSHAWRASPGDVAGFARAIVSWAESWRRPRPINHRQIAIARFDDTKLFRDVLKLYRACMAIPPANGLKTCSPGR